MIQLDKVNDTDIVRHATLRDYIRIARFGHMTKHVFIVPGIILALLLRPQAAGNAVLWLIPELILGLSLIHI